MVRSRNLTLTDWTAANNALLQYFEGNKSKLSNHVKMSRTTITNFFNQKPIGDSSFRKICLALRLNWEQVSSGDITLDSSNDRPGQPVDLPQLDEALIEQIRERCRQKILERHSRMRLLNGEEIEVDQLYVDVWLLEKPEHRHFNTLESLLRTFDIVEDRLALGRRIERNQSFKIANSKPKLVILGKPGSGKTTLIKHLAIDWCKGKFQPNLVTILLELRRIQEPEWNIFNTIGQELRLDNWHQFAVIKQEISRIREKLLNLKKKQLAQKEASEKRIKDLEKQLKSLPLYHLLKQGKILILMDGLDESPSNEVRRNIQNQLREVSQEYPENRFILTCRTQIINSIPSGFNLVEVADFSLEQVKQFVQNWFIVNGYHKDRATQQWAEMWRIITNQPGFKEVIATPVLLNLICMVWKDSGMIPADKTNLYKKGIDLLLRRWNKEKQIEDWEVGTETYRQLSIEDKKTLLIEIAARKFGDSENFILFEQDELVEQITRKLGLFDVREGTAVLRAMATQHGLLIERADALWSFSHLTFQEHFTVQWLAQLPPQQLNKKITNFRWKRIVEQLVKSQQPSNRLLRLIKRAIDQSMVQESSFQSFLYWLLRKSRSIQASYKSASIRAIYCSFVPLTRVRDFSQAFSHALKLARSLDIELDQALESGFGLSLISARTPTLPYAFDRTLDLELTLDRTLELELSLARVLDRALDVDSAISLELELDVALSLALSLELKLSSAFTSQLHQLKNELQTSNHEKELQHWWSLHRDTWIEQLRQIMINYQDIGHDWQFTEQQRRQHQQYYESNTFLVNLMKIEGAVSEECRAEIEDGLLLPWAELQRRQPHLYGELEE